LNSSENYCLQAVDEMSEDISFQLRLKMKGRNSKRDAEDTMVFRP